MGGAPINRRWTSAIALAVLAATLVAASPAVAAPTTLVPPSIELERDPPQDGEILRANDGQYAPELAGQTVTTSREWLRCTDATEASCSPTGATGSTYELGLADVGNRIRLRVTAVCQPLCTGSRTETTQPTAPVVADPLNTDPPQVTAPAGLQEGEGIATSNGSWRTRRSPLSYEYQWQRCEQDGTSCVDIPGATDVGYELTAADVGKRMRARVRASNSGPRSAAAVSAPTGTVAARPPPPPPPPPPLRTVSPFPIVSIAGRAGRTASRISRLTVRAPAGTTVTLRCYDRSCPYSRADARGGRVVRFRRMERLLRARTVIKIWVIHPQQIGKWTRFRILSRRAPSRMDACLPPGRTNPIRCP